MIVYYALFFVRLTLTIKYPRSSVVNKLIQHCQLSILPHENPGNQFSLLFRYACVKLTRKVLRVLPRRVDCSRKNRLSVYYYLFTSPSENGPRVKRRRVLLKQNQQHNQNSKIPTWFVGKIRRRLWRVFDNFLSESVYLRTVENHNPDLVHAPSMLCSLAGKFRNSVADEFSACSSVRSVVAWTGKTKTNQSVITVLNDRVQYYLWRTMQLSPRKVITPARLHA